MNKTELIGCVAEKSGLAKKDAEKAVNAVLDAVVETLKAGEKVQLVGFGNFEVRERAARKGINPLTKQPMDFPATKVPAFKAEPRIFGSFFVPVRPPFVFYREGRKNMI